MNYFKVIFVFILSYSTHCNQNCESLIKYNSNGDMLIKELSTNINTYKSDRRCIPELINKGFYKETTLFVEELGKINVSYKDTIKVNVESIKHKLDDIYNKYRFDDEDFQVVSPAFQWAQSMDHIFLQIKYSHRHDSPGCPEVKNLNIDITKQLFVFTAYCIQADIPIKFELKLEPFAGFNPEQSKHNPGSMGRYHVTLGKIETGMYWDRLLKDGISYPSNARLWLEMHSKYEDDLQSYIDEDEEESYKKVYNEIEKKKIS